MDGGEISRPQRDVGRSHPENANRWLLSRALRAQTERTENALGLSIRQLVLERRLRGGRSGGDVARRGWAVMTTELRALDFGSAGGGSSNMWHQESILVAADAACACGISRFSEQPGPEQGRSRRGLAEPRGAERLQFTQCVDRRERADGRSLGARRDAVAATGVGLREVRMRSSPAAPKVPRRATALLGRGRKTSS